MKVVTHGRALMRACALLALAPAIAVAAEPGPRFNDAGELLRPADYAEWAFLTSGLGMTYGPNGPDPSRPPAFDNAFVNPAAYRAFMQTGKWPEGTMFVLEIRASEENASINNGGRTQGAMRAMEAAVKDTKRYPDGGWAYFSFDGPNGLKDATAPFPRSATCYSCHSQHGAVEWTFTQFYPRLFEVAKQKGTIRADYDPAMKAR